MNGHLGEKWDDLQVRRCPSRVLGYVLKDKHWAQLASNKYNSMIEEEYTDVMKQPHLSEKGRGAQMKKELVVGLTKHHGMGEIELQDIVAEKGKDLVFLLYGEPGAW